MRNCLNSDNYICVISKTKKERADKNTGHEDYLMFKTDAGFNK